ncbi:lysine-specific demethylase 3B-like [Uloborus diversus]|uniref:lysine-specific demethylase 3B-like n=1 Tax=Uloborus diversus TaxID=327109 RepID=UPI00240A781C|nr:lysine-specific demethylase 3B-like [Uloborus diversus]
MPFKSIANSWLCEGRLLFLHEANHPLNNYLFQKQWKRGQPILLSGINKKLDKNLWHPNAFCRDFGEMRNDLVDCMTGAVIKNLPMKKFWEGFQNFSKRLKDDNGEYMVLKLQDWPPGEDFSEKLPSRFEDLMQTLPLPEYTLDGVLNLSGRLPPWFVRPDLGPKMYIAYGSALFPTKGTTNLHLDVSDAVNVMIYVGIPSGKKAHLHIQGAIKTIGAGGCDSLMRERAEQSDVAPDVLWHIYHARDADKIRDMLTKVAVERKKIFEPYCDPIHDQSWYLDEELRERLRREYDVQGYAIVQCQGDAIFIPAGPPHQVLNLHSCVKVAEDFVSPENIARCIKLTQEFRHLTYTHTNHEDKLQIKNIIYHVARDSLFSCSFPS